jgi:hypothetical protein
MAPGKRRNGKEIAGIRQLPGCISPQPARGIELAFLEEAPQE